jgi:uncharacterized membrane protein YedE/YeeE
MMEAVINRIKTDKLVVLLVLFAIFFISMFLQNEFNLKQSLLFLVGIGLGLTLMHAMFGFTGGWRMFIRTRQSLGIRAQIILIATLSIFFFPLIGDLFPELKANAALGQIGFSVLIGAFLFGIGMQLGGGCGSGTLFTVGWGQTDMLITISFFAIGATIGSYHLPWWLSLPNVGKISLISELGWLPALLAQLVVLVLLYKFVSSLDKKRNNQLQNFIAAKTDSSTPFLETLIHGPWPLWWGIIGLAILSLLTLLMAGYPWSITFGFGLWGAKVWAALGGDVANWAYWANGYPARALNQSVLADITSIMNFGIIIGAMLAAALAGKFAPAGEVKAKRVMTAVIGGLMLGYGARLAFGCNIGALVGGISSGSLHGWLWLVAAFSGGIIGVKIRVWLKLDKPYGAGA